MVSEGVTKHQLVVGSLLLQVLALLDDGGGRINAAVVRQQAAGSRARAHSRQPAENRGGKEHEHSTGREQEQEQEQQEWECSVLRVEL